MTHATRPLRLIELAEVVHSTHLAKDQHDFKASKELVRAAAGPLLEILPDETVSVIHHSFTEYLKCETRSKEAGSYPVLHLGAVHSSLASACLRYLQFGSLDDFEIPQNVVEAEHTSDPGYRVPRRSSSSGQANKERQTALKHPFLLYAARDWHIHVQRSADVGTPQDDLNMLIDSLVNNDQHLRAWYVILRLRRVLIST